MRSATLIENTDVWADHNRMGIGFSPPGKPTDNAHVESFNTSVAEVYRYLAVTDCARRARVSRLGNEWTSVTVRGGGMVP